LQALTSLADDLTNGLARARASKSSISFARACQEHHGARVFGIFVSHESPGRRWLQLFLELFIGIHEHFM